MKVSSPDLETTLIQTLSNFSFMSLKMVAMKAVLGEATCFSFIALFFSVVELLWTMIQVSSSWFLAGVLFGLRPGKDDVMDDSAGEAMLLYSDLRAILFCEWGIARVLVWSR